MIHINSVHSCNLHSTREGGGAAECFFHSKFIICIQYCSTVYYKHIQGLWPESRERTCSAISWDLKCAMN